MKDQLQADPDDQYYERHRSGRQPSLPVRLRPHRVEGAADHLRRDPNPPCDRHDENYAELQVQALDGCN